MTKRERGKNYPKVGGGWRNFKRFRRPLNRLRGIDYD